MKRIMACLAVLCALVLISGRTTTVVKAEDVTNVRVPISISFFDNCTGEMIQIVGEAHVVITKTTTPNGTVHTNQHANLHGTAIGLTSGNEYEVNVTFMTHDIKSSDMCGFREKVAERDHFISKGSLPNLVVVLTQTLVQRSDCDFSIEMSAESDCRG